MPALWKVLPMWEWVLLLEEVPELRVLLWLLLELRLVVVILSSVASTREAGDVIGARCQRAHSALGRLEAAISGSQSEAVARKVLVTLRRVADNRDGSPETCTPPSHADVSHCFT